MLRFLVNKVEKSRFVGSGMAIFKNAVENTIHHICKRLFKQMCGYIESEYRRANS